MIKHPTHGLIVFDAGLSVVIGQKGSKALHPITRRLFKTISAPGKDLATQMTAAELAPAAVDMVIYSHLHFDHTGDNTAFNNAHFWIGEGTDTDNLSRLHGFEPALIAQLHARERLHQIAFANAAPYGTFSHVVDLLGDGTVLAFQGGGHLNGSLGLIVQLPGGPVLLAGDEAVHFDWLAQRDVQRISQNPARAGAVRNQINALAALTPEMLIFPGHDLPDIPKARNDIVVHAPGLFRLESWVSK